MRKLAGRTMLVWISTGLYGLGAWAQAAPAVAPPTQPSPVPIQSVQGPKDKEIIWTTVEYGDGEFAVSLPASWTVVTMDEQTAKAAMAAAAKTSPSMEKWLTENLQNAAAKGVKLMAFEQTPETMLKGPSTTINVVAQALPYAASASMVAQVSAGAIAKMLGLSSAPAIKPIMTKGGEGQIFSVNISVKGSDGTSVVKYLEQVYLATNEQMVALTLTCLETDRERLAPLFDEIARSFDLPKTKKPAQVVPVETWMVYTVGSTGLRLDLPKEPQVVKSQSQAVPPNDKFFLGRINLYGCVSNEIVFWVMEGYYKEGRPESVEAALVGGPGWDAILANVPPLSQSGGNITIEGYTESIGSVTKPDKSSRVTKDMVYRDGQVKEVVRASALAANNTAYMVAVFYPEGDSALAKSAERILASMEIEKAPPPTPVEAPEELQTRAPANLLEGPWKRYPLGSSDLTLNLTGPLDEIGTPTTLPYELGDSKSAQTSNFERHEQGLGTEAFLAVLDGQGGTSGDFLSFLFGFTKMWFSAESVPDKDIKTSALDAQTIRMDATTNRQGIPFQISCVLKATETRGLIVTVTYRTDDPVAAKAAQRVLDSVMLPRKAGPKKK